MKTFYPKGYNWFKNYNIIHEEFIHEILQRSETAGENYLIEEGDYYKIIRFLEEKRQKNKLS